MLHSCIAVAAGKGGVLKTTLAAHLAGLAAADRRRVLLVDADPQGNARFDLGVRGDDGANLAAALVGAEPLAPLAEVRPGLDVACGGAALDGVARTLGDRSAWDALERAVPAEQYDLVIVDTPARELWIRRIVLATARCVVVPSAHDRASRVGLVDLARTIEEVRAVANPRLDVLGVVVAPISTVASRVRDRARQRLGDLIDDRQLVCESIPRHAPLVAEMCRDRGLLVHELAALPGASPCASALAADWRALVDEILDRYVDLRRSTPPIATV